MCWDHKPALIPGPSPGKLPAPHNSGQGYTVDAWCRPGTGVKTGFLVTLWFVCCAYSGNTGRDFLERKQSLQWKLAKHSLAMFQHENKGWLSDNGDSHITFSYAETNPSQCVSKTSRTNCKVYFWHKVCPHPFPAPAHRRVQPINFIPLHTCPFVCPHPFAVRWHLWWHHDTVLLRILGLGHCGFL